MACFWEGIRSSLSKDDKNKLGITDNTIPNLITTLKNNNTLDIKVLWQNKALTKKEQEENYTHIKDYNIDSHRNGYLCSTCDPFLILLCNTLNVNINMNIWGISYYIQLIRSIHIFLKVSVVILLIILKCNNP